MDFFSFLSFFRHEQKKKTPGLSTESPTGECSFDCFGSEADGGRGVFGEKEGTGHEGESPDKDSGAEEIRRVDEEIESKVRHGYGVLTLCRLHKG